MPCNDSTTIEDLMKRLEKLEKAVWTTAYQNKLPDENFFYVEPGGEKDEEGKTVPRSLRHLPYKDDEGRIDREHVLAAWQALHGARGGLGDWATPEVKEQIRRKILAAAKKIGLELSEEKSRDVVDTAGIVEDKTEKAEKHMSEEENKAEEVEEVVDEKAEDKPEPQPEEEKETVAKGDEPKREDYESPEEFYKAYSEWIKAKQAEKPVTAVELEKALEDFKKEILASIKDVAILDGVTLGEAVKKSIPLARKTQVAAVDYKEWVSKALELEPQRVLVTEER